MKKFNREIKDIPELVAELRRQKARERDYLLPQSAIEAILDEDGKPALRLAVEKGSQLVSVLDQAHGQVSDKLAIAKNYYDRLVSGDEQDRALWVTNVNHWLAKDGKRKRLIRLLDNAVRAWLSSKYRPISHLDLVTTLVQTATGQLQEGGGFAQGARCFAYRLDPKGLRVEFFQPNLGVDLSHLDKGVRTFGPEDLDDKGFYRGMKVDPKDGEHWVFPSATCDNSETGHGGMGVSQGLLEGYCLNGTVFKRSLSQVHIGRELQEADLWSSDTIKKQNAVIFAKVADIAKATFAPEGFLNLCRKFKGLEAVEVDVKTAADQVAQLDGMTEEVRDDILAAYHATTAGRANLFDFQRAVTATAHAYRETEPDKAAALEELGGAIVERGKAALAAA